MSAVGGGVGGNPTARIEQLDDIQKDVIEILQKAGEALVEIGRDRPSQKAADGLVTQVMTNIKSVEAKLSEQIRYLTQVSTGHPHEGSSYPSQKVLQTAWHRLEHARSSVHELDRIRANSGLAAPQQHQRMQQQPQQQQPQQQQPQQQQHQQQ